MNRGAVCVHRARVVLVALAGASVVMPALAQACPPSPVAMTRVSAAGGTIPPSGELWFDDDDRRGHVEPALRVSGRPAIPLEDDRVLTYRDLPAGPVEVFDLLAIPSFTDPYGRPALFPPRLLTVDPQWTRPAPARVLGARFEPGREGHRRGVVLRFDRPLVGLEARLSDGTIDHLPARTCEGADPAGTDACVTIPSLHLIQPPPHLTELRVVDLDAHRSHASNDAVAITTRTYQAADRADEQAGVPPRTGRLTAALALAGFGLAVLIRRRRARQAAVPG